jgi:hypothetical protein
VIDFIDYKIDWSGSFPDIDFFTEITGEETIMNEVVSAVLADVGSYYWQPSAGTGCLMSKGSNVFPSDLLFLKAQITSNIQSNEYVDDSLVELSINSEGRLVVLISISVGAKQLTQELTI